MDYELIPYARLCDHVVHANNTAPPGYTPWWVPAILFEDSHVLAVKDPRILTDILRRLRGEPPVTVPPPAPLPG